MKASVTILAVCAIVFLVFVFSGLGRGQSSGPNVPANNVTVADGKQIVEVAARGGYYPRLSQAKAGIPTILRMKTNGTYDCSSAISIPSLGVFKNLPPSGSTDIEIPAQSPGARLLGTCAMGMYRFEVDFKG